MRRHYNSAKRSGVRNHVRLDAVRELSNESPAFQFRNPETTPSQVAMKLEEIDQLRSAIERLCSEDQELVRLRHVQQKTIREIAEIKNAGLSEISYACQRALRRLHRILSLQEESQ